MYFECTYRVPYADTDQMGVVYYANYFEYFERGRTEMLRSVGAPYSVLEKEGAFLPVIEAHCDYFGSAKYDDLLTFRSYVESRSRIKLKICTEVLRENELLVRGYVVLGCVNADKRPVRMPESLAACCDKLMWNSKLISPEELYPLKFAPIYQERIWGGNQMTEVLKRELPEHSSPIGEAWELCDRDGIQSKVVNGRLAGVELSELVKNYRKDLLGTKAADAERFPLLMKLIDSGEKLSLQVHPDEAACGKIGGGAESKTEMWYILSARPRADILAGLNSGLSENQVIDLLRAGKTDDLLQIYPSQSRDAYFIPSGTLHAIGAGILICEIQQNSNTTYRVYDYNRRDKDGNLRPLHVAKALEVSNLQKSPDLPATPDGADILLAACEYFEVRRLRVNGSATVTVDESSFVSLMVTDGEGTLAYADGEIAFSKGDSLFIPAQTAAFTVNGTCELIRSKVN